MRASACFVLVSLAGILFLASPPAAWAAEVESFDVVVYGGTSGGMAAAVQARRLGKSAVLIEPGQHLGGLSSGGLGATDIGNKAAIGGLAREFYRRVRKHYENPAAWTRIQPEQYRSGRGSEQGQEEAMWTFEPHVAEKLMREMAAEAQVSVVYGERLDRAGGVTKQNGALVSLRMESGRTFAGRAFIDATYEGDLLAATGVSYHVGREANSVYGETLNGVQTKHATKHQFVAGVDPYVVKGNKASGLLPGVHGDSPGEEGSGDARVQAYNFRMCLTDVPENRIPFAKPERYDPLRYELLLRNFEAGETRAPWNPVGMPNRKTDTNNNHGFSTDNIGMNYAWPEASYAERDRIFREHLQYQQGLMYTLATSERVPEKVRQQFNQWGLCRDEFTATGGWPHQLYVREGRRMIADYVMTQSDCQGRRRCEDPVGLGAYNMDSHNVQRYVTPQGEVRNEGDIQVGVSPYPISYRALVPKAAECTNLLVPVCLSSSHIAYGSIRMEPVFMVLGQSAATAAVLALEGNSTVQQVAYAALRQRLEADGQVLEWKGPVKASAQGIDPAKLPGLVLDDSQGQKSGTWSEGSSVGPFVGSGYLHDNDDEKGQKQVRFAVAVKTSGRYEVRLAYSAQANRASAVEVTIEHAGGQVARKIDQRQPAKVEGLFEPLGTYEFSAERAGAVVVSNAGSRGHVIVDAVQLIPVP